VRCEVASAVPSRNFYISNLQRQISSKKGVRTTYRPPQMHRRTKCSGMSLQICRSRFNFDPAARRLRTLFVPALWQGCAQPSSFSFRSDGMAVHVYMRRNVLVTNSLAPDSYRSGINRNIKLVNMKIDVR
jgi:hypothetical protein